MLELPKIDIRPDHWGIVRDILQKQVPQYAVWAFGSRAKWTAKEYSDLDLAIITDKPLSLDVSASLSDDFSESDLPWKVDIVDWASTSESFKKVIERDKVVVQEGKTGAAGWKNLTLGKFVRLQRGYDLTATEQKSGPVPVIGSAGPNGTHTEAKASGPGVVIGRSGASMGRVHFCDQDYWPHNTCLYVTDFLGNDPLFVYYKLAELDLARYNSGSAQPSLNRNYIYGMKLSVPDPIVQRQISNMIRRFDDKIALNRRINQTIEAMAQAIFKSWFVDFDPVRAKVAAIEQGQDPLRAAMRAISGKTDAELDQMPREHHDQLAATAALFPDAMEESELGEIPKGWSVLSFGDVAQQGKGTVNPRISPEELFCHYSLPAFDASQLPIVESGESIKSNKTPVPNGAVLVSKLNPHIPRIWLVGKAGERSVCSTEFIVWTPKGPANSAFLFGLASSPNFISSMRQLVTGTSNSHQRVKPEQIAGIRVFAANNEAIAQHSMTVAPLMEKMVRIREEASILAQLRDTLLPKLLSGGLSINPMQEANDD